jgi:hypothetical protein
MTNSERARAYRYRKLIERLLADPRVPEATKAYLKCTST